MNELTTSARPELYLLDTNVLARLSEVSSPMHKIALGAVETLTARGDLLFITPQNLIEFWNMATRPSDKNGMGLSSSEAATQIEKHEAAFRLLPDSEKIFDEWKQLVKRHSIQGVNVHDTRLASVAISSGIPNILTFNGKDFRRFESDGLKVVDPNEVRDFQSKPGQIPNQIITVFDFETNSSNQIPARELAQGMTQINFIDDEGNEQLGWIDPRQLTKLRSEIQYKGEFNKDISNLLREIKEAVFEFYPQTLKQWEDGFRRDANPGKEIALWLHIARTYKCLISKRALTKLERKDYFNVVLGCSMSPRDQLLTVAKRKVISDEVVEEIVEAFYGGIERLPSE